MRMVGNSTVILSGAKDPSPFSELPANERGPSGAAHPQDDSALWRYALIAGTIVLLVALWAIDSFPVGVVQDDGMYVVLAKSLATGQGFRWINIPGAPAATHYPPGYPALLALLWRIAPSFPANVIVFKAVNAVLLALASGALVVLARRRFNLSARVAALVAILGGIAIPTLVLSTLVMSEMLFLALLVPSLVFAERVLSSAREDESVRDALLLGVAAVALMLVRTHGLAFAVAVAAAFALARRRRALAIFAATTLVCILPWQLWKATHRDVVAEPLRGAYESYGGWLLNGTHGSPLVLAARTVARTSNELFAMMAQLSTAGLPTFGLRLIVVLTAIGLLLGGLFAIRNIARVTALFFAAYLGVILLWPFTPARFVWGVWPIVLLICAAGVQTVLQWRSPARFGIAAAVLCVFAGYGVYSFRGYRGRWWSSIPRSTAPLVGPSIVWTLEHTKPTDVVATVDEPMMYLYTGRLAVPVSRFTADDYFATPTVPARMQSLRSILDAYHADVVVIIANDSLEAAARRLAAPPESSLALRDSVPHGLILTPTVR